MKFSPSLEKIACYQIYLIGLHAENSLEMWVGWREWVVLPIMMALPTDAEIE